MLVAGDWVLLFLLVGELDDVVGGAVEYAAEFLQSKQGDIAVFLEGIQSFVINAGLQQLILGNLAFLHSLPKGREVDHRITAFFFYDKQKKENNIL